jgi:hypothetical protein
MMTPKFLREEAARFRGMAETVERDASRLRLLAMAADYESQANAADELTQPDGGEAINVKAGRKIAKGTEEPV